MAVVLNMPISLQLITPHASQDIMLKQRRRNWNYGLSYTWTSFFFVNCPLFK